jgi:hypothetical protein
MKSNIYKNRGKKFKNSDWSLSFMSYVQFTGPIRFHQFDVRAHVTIRADVKLVKPNRI